MSKLVKLPCGLETVIDDVDAYLLELFPYWRSNKGRVIITRYLENEYGLVRQDVYLSIAIVKPPRGMMVDHIDRNPLNNLRSNLRVASASQNAANRKKVANKTSQYIGVSLAKGAMTNKWRMYLRGEKGKRIYGSFSNEIDAAKAYDIHARKMFGEFANLNFPSK